MTSPDPTILLSGVVGSTAYGLTGPHSDIDKLAVFAYPTTAILGLHPPADSLVETLPDRTMHEAGKYVRLALAGNPTVTELLWLDTYETTTDLGKQLVNIRSAFLSAGRVRDAYLGYATGQFRRLERRGDGTFSADTAKRTAKHARHLMRLCWQGFELYSTGLLPIRVDDPGRFHEFGERVAGGEVEAARALIGDYEARFDAATPAVSDVPDGRLVEDWLLAVRREMWS